MTLKSLRLSYGSVAVTATVVSRTAIAVAAALRRFLNKSAVRSQTMVENGEEIALCDAPAELDWVSYYYVIIR